MKHIIIREDNRPDMIAVQTRDENVFQIIANDMTSANAAKIVNALNATE